MQIKQPYVTWLVQADAESHINNLWQSYVEAL